MITAAYTICKNEIKFVEKWLYYTERFTYRVLLDTGSTDGTWEALQEAASKDSNLLIEQATFTPWRFDTARKLNLEMVPDEVEWALSPDMDEYFSINVLTQMEKTISQHPTVTNISCDRLDIYSDVVRVGPPNFLGTNKIHRRHDYTWVQPIYEHLSWVHKGRPEVEVYNPDIYLVHDQDFKKASRSDLYFKMLREEYETNPTNAWILWFLVNHYYRQKDLENYVLTATDFLRCSARDERFTIVREDLTNILAHQATADAFLLERITTALRETAR